MPKEWNIEEIYKPNKGKMRKLQAVKGKKKENLSRK